MPASTQQTVRDLQTFYTKVRALSETERYWDLNRYEAIWKGTRYELGGLASWWDNSVPIRDRAPIIAYPLAKSAGNRLNSFVFGEGRFPVPSVGNGGSELAGIQLTPEQAQILTQGATAVIKATKLRLRMRETLEHGLMCGTGVLIGSIRAGRLCVDLTYAKWCTPEFDPFEDDRIRKLTIRYQHPSTTLRDQHTGDPTPVWYLRVIDETTDVTWDDVPVHPNGYEPNWNAIPPIAKFDIEFCAVEWARNMPDSASPDIDGRALFEDLDDELQCLDRALSQRDRNVLQNGDPQWIVTGAGAEELKSGGTASPGHSPALKGTQTTAIMRSAQRVWDNIISGGPNANTIRKGAGPWFLSKEGADAKMLESSGAGAAMLTNHANDLRQKLLEVVNVVMLDPEKVSGDMPAAAIDNLYAPMFSLCDNLREVWGPVLVRTIGMCFRLMLTKAAWEIDPITKNPTGRPAIRGIPQMAELCSVLRLFQVPSRDQKGALTTEWICPPLELEWGPYIARGAVDRLAAAQAATAAEPFLTKRSIVQSMAADWGIEDVENELATQGLEDQQKGQAARNLLSGIMQGKNPAVPPAQNQPPPAAALPGKAPNE